MECYQLLQEAGTSSPLILIASHANSTSLALQKKQTELQVSKRYTSYMMNCC